MSPMLDISDQTFRRLQSHGVAFVDSPESVIIRLLDFMEQNSTIRNAQQPSSHGTAIPLPSGARSLDAEHPESLTHTKVLGAVFGSRLADKWNELLIIAHQEALQKLGSFDAVKEISTAAIDKRNRGDSGYHFQPSLGFSIQYVDSNNAWRQILNLAKRLGVNVEVKFRWREKDGAAFPGEYGVLRWAPAH